MTEFDSTKPVQTRGGEPARIICTDRAPPYSIVALIDSSERVEIFTKDGKFVDEEHETDDDLINIPEQIESWFYRSPDGAYMRDARGPKAGQDKSRWFYLKEMEPPNSRPRKDTP